LHDTDPTFMENLDISGDLEVVISRPRIFEVRMGRVCYTYLIGSGISLANSNSLCEVMVNTVVVND